ncbi:MAG: putative capsular polysaccharide synthesis family protein [Caldilineaceae bacterium]
MEMKLEKPAGPAGTLTKQLRRTAKQTMRQLFGERNQYYLRARAYLWLDRWRGRRPLFVHQMGKVGSTTVVNSLLPYLQGQKRVIHQTHFLSFEGTAFVEELEISGHGSWQRLPPKTKRFLIKSRVLGQALSNGYPGQDKAQVITLVRDPVATNISGFFHNADWWPPTLIAQCQARSTGWKTALLEQFLTTYPHDTPLRWFDIELKPIFGVDVYATTFPYAQGYQVYETAKTHLLLLKLEALNTSAPAAFQAFMGINDFALVKTNLAEDKWYADLYQEFMQDLSLPSSYLSQLYDSRYTRHFYSNAERQALATRWSSPA